MMYTAVRKQPRKEQEKRVWHCQRRLIVMPGRGNPSMCTIICSPA